MSPPLEARPRSPWLGFAFFIACWGAGAGTAVLFAAHEFAFAAASTVAAIAQCVALALAYLAGGYFLLLYLVFAPYRFRFGESSFDVFTWRGWMTFAWSQIQRAELSSNRGLVEFVLFVGPVRRVSVPLNAFHSAGALLAGISARLPVAVAATPAALDLVKDR